MLERDAGHLLTGVIEINSAYWGGECHAQTPGRGSPNNSTLVAAPSYARFGYERRLIEGWKAAHCC